MSLTNKTKYKAFAGIKSSNISNDPALNRIIPAVSDLVQNQCQRTFALTEYRKWFDGSGSPQQFIPDWPITRIYEVSTGTEAAIKLMYTGGTRATGTYDGTTLYLWQTSTEGASTDTAITVSSFATMTLLAAEIEGNTGWTADVQSGEGTQPTSMLKPFGAAWCFDPTSCTMNRADDTSSTARIVEGTHRIIELASGGTFPRGHSNVFAWYKAGYTLPTEIGGLDAGNVPDGLEMIVNQSIQDTLDLSKHDGTLKSEKIGNYQYTMSDIAAGKADGAIPVIIDKYWGDLSAYARRTA